MKHHQREMSTVESTVSSQIICRFMRPTTANHTVSCVTRVTSAYKTSNSIWTSCSSCCAIVGSCCAFVDVWNNK